MRLSNIIIIIIIIIINYGKRRSSLLIESTDSMIYAIFIIIYNTDKYTEVAHVRFDLTTVTVEKILHQD